MAIAEIIAGAVQGTTGGVGNIWKNYHDVKNQRKSNELQKELIEEKKKIIAEGYDGIDDYLADYGNVVNSRKLTTDADRQSYANFLRDYDAADYIAERGNFNASKYKVEDYLDANKESILNAVGDGVSRTQAGAGVGRGTGAATGIVNAQISKNNELMRDAYARMLDERNFDYTEFNRQYEANQAALDKLSQGRLQQMQMLGGALQADDQRIDDYYNDLVAAKTGRVNAAVQI